MADKKKLEDIVREAIEDEELGTTGEFPEGKISKDDLGEIKFAIAIYNSLVVVNFGSPVTWFAISPEQADELAAVLMEKAQEIRGERKH